MKFVFKPREWDPEGNERLQVGWAPPVVDMHERPLVSSRFVPVTDPSCTTVITAGEVFEPSDRFLREFCSSSPVFRKVHG